jgi:Zn-dependent metalloprotease/chitodextrinase
MKSMKKNTIAHWLLITAFICSCFMGYTQTPSRSDDVSPKLKSILKGDSKKGWHRFTEDVKFDPASPEKFFEQHREAFELQDGFGMNLILHTAEKNLGMNHYKFQQTFNGIPIAGAEYILHQREKQPLKGNGMIVPSFRKNEKPAISSEAALASALAQVNASRYAWEDPEMEKMVKKQKGDKATLYPQPRLVYFSTSDDREASSYQLVYEMKVFAVKPMSNQQFYISAADGSVVQKINLIHDSNTPATGTTKYNGVQSITTDFTGSNYVLKETNRGGSGTAISTYDMNNSINYVSAVNYQNNSTTWNNEPVGVQGHWGVEKTFDYFYGVHGRNSFNNSGAEVIAYLDYDINYNNASWNGFFMTFGGGNGTTRTSWASLDVVAHEFTHGVTEFSAGLVYQNESGALNESFSDIFGATVEFQVEGANGNWLLSEDVTVNGSGIRSMINPNAFSDPDTYHGTFWEFTGADNGGVHTNSGVQNHWYYLLSQGGSGTNDIGNSYAVAGIGMDMAAAIAYRNLTQYLTTDSRYRDAREGALEAAEDLYGRTSNAYAQTAMAWYAVGVGFPAYTTQDLGLRSVTVGGGGCDQLVLELVNLSTLATIPAGAVIDVMIKENNVVKPTEQIILSAALTPGGSLTTVMSQVVNSTNGKIAIEAQVNYPPDPEPGNNIALATILRGIMTIGGTTPDFVTIDQAIAALNDQNASLCGHVDFKLRSGQYNGEVRIINVKAVSSAHTVTFESESGNPNDVIINSPININSAYGAITIENTEGIRIRNLTIIRQATPSLFGAVGVALRNEINDFILEGNKIRCLGISGPNRHNVDLQPYGLSQRNITIRNNLLEAANNGITISGGDRIDNFVIENNTLTGHKVPISIRCTNVVVRNNKITTANLGNSGAGVSVDATGELLFEGNDLRVDVPASTNIFGLNIERAAYARMYNNMINVTATAGQIGVNVSNQVGTAEFYHNTIRLQRLGTGTGQVIAVDYKSDLTSSAVWNNIFTSITNGAVGLKLGGQDILSNYNDFFFPNGAVGSVNGTKYTTLQLWQDATNYDLNSVAVQPVFVSTTDLHLGSQQPNLRSILSTVVKNDIDGELRFVFPNMGADDYFAPNTGDLGITAIRLLPGSSCDRKVVQIDIKNTGTIPYASGMQLPVSYRINTTNATTQTLTLPQNFAAGQIITFTFSQHAVFPPLQNYVLVAGIDRPDANLANNTSINLSIIRKSVFTVGGVNPDFTTIKQGIDFISGALNTCPQPSISFVIRPGVYTDPLSIVEIPGSTLSFESETGNRADVVITSSTVSTISLTGSKHVTFKNLSIAYLGTSAAEAGILVKNACENITITNCNLSMPAIAAEHYAIKAGPSLIPQLNGLNVTHNTFTNGGIKMESNVNVSYPFDNIQIDSNTFVNSYTHAISLSRTGLVTVYDNTITSANTSSGISITQPQKDVRIERNKITLEAGVNGIYFYNLIPSFSRIYVFNNFVNVKSGANAVSGITIDGKGGYLYHNTVKLSTGPVQPTGIASALTTRNSSIAVRHNIFYNTVNAGVGIDWLSTSSNQDYNNIYVPNGSIAKRNVQYYSTLAAWQTASGLDLQSTTVEPAFVSSNDLHLATYQPELRGSNVSLFPFVQIDIDGNSRTLPMYIGADEFIRPPFVDLSPIGITNVPLFGHSYSIDVTSNSDREIVTLPVGITVSQVTPEGFLITVDPNPLGTSRDLILNVRTTSTPVGSASLHISQEGPPALTGVAGNGVAVLNWTVATGNVANYRIYFSEGGPLATTLLATVPGTETTFTHNGLSNGSTYVYQLSAIDSSGTESAKSPAITVIPTPPFITLSPSEIAGVTLFGGKYTIEVSSNTNWTIVPPIPDEVLVSNVSAGRFRVTVAANPLGTPRDFLLSLQTSQSPQATTNLHLIQEGTPTLTAQGGDRMVGLSWTVATGAAQYKVYSVLRDRPTLLATLTESHTTFIHTGLTNGVAYAYQVSVVDPRGNESALSNVAIAIPQRRGFLSKDQSDTRSESLSLYPNPVEDKLVLRGQIKMSGTYSAAIMNSYGLAIQEHRVDLKSGEIESEVNVNKFSPGIYLLLVADPSGKVIATIRFEKK